MFFLEKPVPKTRVPTTPNEAYGISPVVTGGISATDEVVLNEAQQTFETKTDVSEDQPTIEAYATATAAISEMETYIKAYATVSITASSRIQMEMNEAYGTKRADYHQNEILTQRNDAYHRIQDCQ